MRESLQLHQFKTALVPWIPGGERHLVSCTAFRPRSARGPGALRQRNVLACKLQKIQRQDRFQGCITCLLVIKGDILRCCGSTLFLFALLSHATGLYKSEKPESLILQSQLRKKKARLPRIVSDPIDSSLPKAKHLWRGKLSLPASASAEGPEDVLSQSWIRC